MNSNQQPRTMSESEKYDVLEKIGNCRIPHFGAQLIISRPWILRSHQKGAQEGGWTSALSKRNKLHSYVAEGKGTVTRRVLDFV
jgi:hypothetical protein